MRYIKLFEKFTETEESNRLSKRELKRLKYHNKIEDILI